MIPSLSKWRIDQAHDHAIKSGKRQPVEDKPVFRLRKSQLNESQSLFRFHFSSRTVPRHCDWTQVNALLFQLL